ncbi:hypothetical protein [Pseudomonas batumici]|uniref:hypothetical protein n=1 Tax=Pseudomonas batumici TaxID=226910 RepID=UPI0012ED40E9|nr:hypothetical protein [Pseudomonas batumici]
MSTRYCVKAAFFLLISSLFLSGSALAQSDDIQTAIKQGQVFADLKALETFLAHDGGSVSGATTGELSGIGEVQAITIRHTEPLMSLQIALLAHDTNGSLRVIAQTKVVSSGYLEATARIERGSLFIDLDAIKGAWGGYQFKQQADGRLRLIGIKLHRASDSGEPDHDLVAVVDTDFNLVTGKMLFKRKGDPRPLKAQVHGPACYFEGFDFDFYACATSMKTADGTPADDLMNTP